MNAKKRSLIPRSIKLLPAAAISLIVLAILSLLGLLNFNPPSLSDSADNSANDQEQVETNTEAADGAALVSAAMLDSPNESTPADSTPAKTTQGQTEPTDERQTAVESPLVPLQRVDVLIDGDDFLMAMGQRGEELVRERRGIAEIITAANATAGDASGIKIRITRTFTATAEAERTLLTALTDAGLSDDQIDQRRTLVDQ